MTSQLQYSNQVEVNMNDFCRFSRDHVVECSERTVFILSSTSLFMLATFRPDDGRSISRNVANINKLVQDKIKLFFQNILQQVEVLFSITQTIMNIAASNFLG